MIGMIVVFLGVAIGDLVFFRVVQLKSINNDKTGICWAIKSLSYHGYSSFEDVSLINSDLLVFFRLIFDQGVCFRVHKFLWLGIF